MNLVLTILLGYLLGTLSPAALISKLKKTDLRTQGTGNLGASNTTLIFGKALGALVMGFDIAKGYFACKLALLLFPELPCADLIAGLCAVIGHIFPFYMKFKGGKGLAAFGGLVLAFDPVIFLILLTLGLVLIFIFNYSAVMPMSAGVLFPIMAVLKRRSLSVFLLTLAASVIIMIKHASNLTKGRQGKDYSTREVFRKLFTKKKDQP